MHLYILSGAGLSAESGIPTFRTGPDATWEGHKIEEVCTHSTWRRYYGKVHAFYNARRMKLGEVQPNAAHEMIAHWHRTYETTSITTNVDDLLERAGCPEPLHLHGRLTRLICEPRGPDAAREATGCGHQWDIGYREFLTHQEGCPACGSRNNCKPAVVFFGETPPEIQVYKKTLKEVQPRDAFVVIGTSGAVRLANRWVDQTVNRLTCLKILNNLEPSPHLNHEVFKYHLFEPATTGLQRVDQLLRKHFGH